MPDKRHENGSETTAKQLREKPYLRRSGDHAFPSEPPSLETMVFCANEADVEKVRSLSRPSLEELGFTWEADVQEVSSVIGTSSFPWLKEAPNPHLYGFITSLKSTWLVFRSLAVQFNDAIRLLISLRANELYFDRALCIHENIENEEALNRVEIEGNHLDSELPRGLLFRAKVAKVKATGTAACVLMINHAVSDAVTLNSFREDLDLSVAGLSRRQRTPYKVFADTYFLHQSSLTARRAIEFHLDRLRHLGSMKETLWPPTNRILSHRNNNENASSNGESMEFRNIPVFNSSQPFSSIPSSIIVKAAIAICNTHRTGSNYAILSKLLAARRWPFLEKGLTDLLPSPLDIAGPTMTHSVDIVQIDGQETAGQFLSRLHHEERLQKIYAHVPRDIISLLSDDSRAVYQDALRQFYNWVPAATVHDKPWLKLVQQRDLRGPGRVFVWELSRLREDGEVKMRILYDADLFSPADVESLGNELVDTIRWLCDRGNWDTNIMHMPLFVEISSKHLQPSSKL